MQIEEHPEPTLKETEGWEKVGEFHYSNGDDEEPSMIIWERGQLRIYYSTYGSNGRCLSSRRFMPTSDDGALFDRRGAARRFNTFTAAKEAILKAYGHSDEYQVHPEIKSRSALRILDRIMNPVLGSKHRR